MRANTTHSKGGMRQKGQEREGQNSGEQRHWKEEGWGGEHGGTQDGHYRDFQDLTREGTFGKESREFEGGVFGVD